MVWFQCEDCGENLKKPKLPNHFRCCSANKLSCIDCGQMFSRQSVQSHTQCISEAEKYGPKGEGKASQNIQTKNDKPKKNSDVDVNVGLSSCAPWFCSLCNTHATSKQALLLHADGKKHRAKARAFHATQKQSNQTEEPTPKESGVAGTNQKEESVEANGSMCKIQEMDVSKDVSVVTTEGQKESKKRGKRKHDPSSKELGSRTEVNDACDVSNGEVIQVGESQALQHKSKKKKCEDEVNNQATKEASKTKIKWKKLISSALKTDSSGVMKLKKLKKLVITALRETDVTGDEAQLQDTLMHKINSSSRFIVDNKHIRLVVKT